MASNLRVDQITASTTGSVSIGTATFTGSVSLPSGGVTVATGATISGSTNTITASTNGSERVRITSDGHIGIAKSSPVSWGVDIPTIEIKGTASTGGNSTRSGAIAFESGSGSNGYAVLWGQEGGIHIYTSATNRDATTYSSKFHSDGNLHFASGNGIDFSAASGSAAGSTSALLDDYEEGTWTPVILGTSIDPTITYTNRVGRYTKIGNQVTIWCFIHINTVSGGNGDVNIGGLPFNNANVPQASEGATLVINYYANFSALTAGRFPTGYVRNNNDKIYFIIGGTGTASGTLPTTSLNNSLLLYGCATYFANT